MTNRNYEILSGDTVVAVWQDNKLNIVKDGFTMFGEGIIDGNGEKAWKAFWQRKKWNPECTNKDEQRPRLVFFSNCNMKCKFCQNYKISAESKGKEITIEELADTFLNLQEQGANNINLVTPTIYAYQIIEAIKIAKGNLHRE